MKKIVIAAILLMTHTGLAFGGSINNGSAGSIVAPQEPNTGCTSNCDTTISVPEPSTLALFGAGIIGLFAARQILKK